MIERIGHACYRWRQGLSLALVVAAVVLARPLARQRGVALALDAAAFALVASGGGIRTWAMGYHGWRRRRAEGARRRLITAGPYAIVRNPLYLGTLMISAGITLMSGSAWIVVFFALLCLGYYTIVRWEEGRLRAGFGDTYGRYFDSVPRLVPAPRLWTPREGEFSLATAMRCMEPIKTVGFLVVLALMLYLKTTRAAP